MARKPRPSDQARFYRRTDGQIVFVHCVDGKVKQRRVPKDIIGMAEAREWVGQQFKPVEPVRDLTRREKLLNLAEQSPNENERNNARRALEKMDAHR